MKQRTMKAVGIIAEYNPFHNGHQYHLRESMRLTGADASVAVMSGNFVQRGEPACLEKWVRAEMAVKSGVDLVLELPFVYAVNSAEFFAKGAIRLLEGLGCVEAVCFGSEEGNLDQLSAAAAILAEENGEFRTELKKKLDTGMSYPKARSAVLSQFFPNGGSLLKGPNNILAVEYLKQLLLTNSAIQAVAIKREGAEYLSKTLPERMKKTDSFMQFASASAIRAVIHEKRGENPDFQWIYQFLPSQSADVLKRFYDDVYINLNDFYPLLVYAVLSSEPAELAAILSVGEGLENRLLEKIRIADSAEELVALVLSKRYTQTRIQRMLIQILTGLTREAFQKIDKNNAMYGRVLGFSQRGARLLKEMKKSGCCRIPLLTNVNRDRLFSPEEELLLSYDVKASDLYHLAGGKNLYHFSDFVRTPYCVTL